MATKVPYYRRWIAQVARQLWAYLWTQVVAIIAGLAILLLEIVFRGESETAFGPAVRATLWVYGSLVVGYLVCQVFYAPIILDREHADENEHQAQEIIALKAAAAAPRFHTMLKNVQLSFQPNEPTRFHARVEIRNISGERTTLHELTLTCIHGPAMTLSNPDRRYLLAPADALETGTHCDGNLIFVGTRMEAAHVEALKGTEWQFTFADIRGQRYGSNICELKYPA